MKFFFVSILFLGSLSLFATPRVEVFFESTSSGYEIYASNEEPCPVTVNFVFDLVNLTTAHEEGTMFVIPAGEKNFKITELTIAQKTKSYTFKYTTNFNYGDHNKKDFDAAFNYYLPFEKGASFTVGQGYEGEMSHQEKFAIDFNMPIGTVITAARGGIVVQVIDENEKNCPSQECEKYNNVLLVYHSDGTFAKYAHIQKNGALVEVGDEVEIGQPIAKSGNVGWSTGPHLHFEVYLQGLKEQRTVKTNFKIDDGSDERILVQNQRYHRDYD